MIDESLFFINYRAYFYLSLTFIISLIIVLLLYKLTGHNFWDQHFWGAKFFVFLSFCLGWVCFALLAVSDAKVGIVVLLTDAKVGIVVLLTDAKVGIVAGWLLADRKGEAFSVFT
jgi:hypothetical protein